jgi:hypothetical protein
VHRSHWPAAPFTRQPAQRVAFLSRVTERRLGRRAGEPGRPPRPTAGRSRRRISCRAYCGHPGHRPARNRSSRLE